MTVEAILATTTRTATGPRASRSTGSNADKARGTQAAIWHFTDGFEPRAPSPGDNPATVVANYETILAAVAAGLEGFGEPTVTLSITPPESTEGTVGGLVGPYVVDTTADSRDASRRPKGSRWSTARASPSPARSSTAPSCGSRPTPRARARSRATASATADCRPGVRGPGPADADPGDPGHRSRREAEAVVSFAEPTTTTDARDDDHHGARDHHHDGARSRPTRRSSPTPTTVPITPSQGEGGGPARSPVPSR